MSVEFVRSPSARTEQLGFHKMYFHEIWYICIFWKSVVPVSLHSDKNTGYCTCRPIYIFWLYLAHFFLEWEMCQTAVVEKIKTHILCSVTCFESRAVYEIMWENLERGAPQMAIRRMRIACWIPKATNTHPGCVIVIAFPPQLRLQEHASLLRHTYSTLPVFSFPWTTSEIVAVCVSSPLHSLGYQAEPLGSYDRASWAKCEDRENQKDATIICLLPTSVSTCFGHH